MQFGEEKPEPSICKRCGAVRAYSSQDGFTWVREKCDCDYKREQLRQEALDRARELHVTSLIINGLRELNIPNRYSAAYLRDNTEPRFKPLVSWSETIDQQMKGWFIYGEVGLGKTKLAFDMLRRSIECGSLIVGRDERDISRIRRMGASWIYTPDWVELQRPGHDNPAAIDTLSQVRKAYLLLIDDILPKQRDNQPPPTPFYVERVNALINDRSNRCLPTIITSNYSLADIGKLLGHPIMSRIRGMCDIFELTGRDRRLGGTL